MTRSDIDVLLARHLQSFASRNADTLAADHTEDGTFYSPAASTVTGRAEIRKVYEYWLTAFPDLAFTWDTPIVEGDRVALFWQFRGTISGPFYGAVRPGTQVAFAGAAEYRVSPGGIVSARHLFDFTGALVVAGVLKVKPAS
jgi:predicted ester cyclase